ncbi:hypothetical protein DV711_06445 [Motiliproteus coralliicola]|uniref:Uncharacterized protein n=1 Tax=Motiliproteus coralliicola TaxID=2283196 RepID=A0A369WU45_9GAMM|nr:hypothetical protein [Motiliproteus coralliicola]RDE25192.1 hypothetical protein DV711_06445 [Motiliproteus coralliicola]
MESNAQQAETDDQIEQLRGLLLADIHTMINFALESGIPIPKELRSEISQLLEPGVNNKREQQP